MRGDRHNEAPTYFAGGSMSLYECVDLFAVGFVRTSTSTASVVVRVTSLAD